MSCPARFVTANSAKRAFLFGAFVYPTNVIVTAPAPSGAGGQVASSTTTRITTIPATNAQRLEGARIVQPSNPPHSIRRTPVSQPDTPLFGTRPAHFGLVVPDVEQQTRFGRPGKSEQARSRALKRSSRSS